MKYTIKMLIYEYQLRLTQTQELYDITLDENLKDVISIQINIYSKIINDLEQL